MFDFQTLAVTVQGSTNPYFLSLQFPFDGVLSRASLAIQSFDLHFTDSDHHVRNLQIVPTELDWTSSPKVLQAKVLINLRDDDAHRAFAGSVALTAIVEREPTWIRLQNQSTKHYLCAENGGGGEVHANRPLPSIWETFALEGELRYSCDVWFRTCDGSHYLQPFNDVNHTLTGQGFWARPREALQIVSVQPDPNWTPHAASPRRNVFGLKNGERIQHNDTVVLQAQYNINRYFVVDASNKLVATATDPEHATVFVVNLP